MSLFETSISWASGPIAFLVSLAACWVLARSAPRLGLVDPGDGGRKIQKVPLPWVGGLAIALGLAAAWTLEWLVFGRAPGPMAPGAWIVACDSARGLCEFGTFYPGDAPWIFGALATAFGVGLVDDLARSGLRPLAKLVGQTLAGCVLAGPLLAAGDPSGLLLVLATLVALNALNTFDNADGAASSITLLALAPLQPVAAAAILGFLPINVRRSDGRAFSGHLPRAILGDSGSHLLGMLILVTPLAWPILALPLLDLLRVCLERLRAGQPPWVGDRRHLAHRFERRSMSPLSTALLLVLIAAPSILAVHALPGLEPLTALLVGLGVTHLLFVTAVAASSSPLGEGARSRAAGSSQLGLEA